MDKPEALRLAGELERDKWHVPAVVMQAAADELRCLHAENAALRAALAQQDEPKGGGNLPPPLQAKPVQEPVAWYRPSIAPDYYAPVFVAGAQPPAPLTQAEARLLGWRPLVPPKAEPVQEPVATVTECEACFTPDVCQLRGTCDYYTASQMRIATPPQRQPLTEEEIVDAVREADLDWQKGWTLDETQSNRFVTLVRAVEQAHGIGEQP